MEGGNQIMSVDQRVVEMRFNNQQFESGIKTSVKSLDNLKKGLDLDGASRSLSNLNREGKGFSLSGISTGVDAISTKFTALGIVGVTALVNLANEAVNAGKRMIMALTIDPINMGLQEYETKMGAIQTILTNTASKGSTLDEINEVLNELNEYSDKTIYNFAEMAKNIGTFTAAGVGLKESAIAIKGIANLAAGSGSTSEQASTAMYQLSQALAAGSLKLQDWNSVVNAGMGGELFKNALMDTAKGMGIVIDKSIPFRESLESGWITAEVLTKTLAKFADDESLVIAATQVKTFTQLINTMKESVQSGWAQSWENIIGDKEQSAKMLTDLNNAFGSLIGPATEARNEMLKFWNQNGGRDALIEAVTNSLKALAGILRPIGVAFREIFPATTGARLVEITKAFRDLTTTFKIGQDRTDGVKSSFGELNAKFKLSEETASNIKSTFKGLFALLDIGRMAVVTIGTTIGSLIKYLIPAGGGLLSFTGNVGDFIVSIRDAIKTSDTFNVAIEKIGNVLKPIADGIAATIGMIVTTFKALGGMDLTGVENMSEQVQVALEPVSEIGTTIQDKFFNIIDVLKKVFPIIFKLASIIGEAFGKLRESIVNGLDGTELNTLINGGIFAAILFGIKRFMDSISSIVDGASGVFDGITGILDGVQGSLEAYQNNLKAGILLKIAFAIGILAVSLLTLSKIDPEKLGVAMSAMTGMFVELFGAMAVFSRVMGTFGTFSMIGITLALTGLSVAILILTEAVTKLAELDWEGLSQGLLGVAVLCAILVKTAKALSTSSGAIIRGSLGFILFAVAINILAEAVIKLAAIPAGSMAKGLIGVGVIMAELALFMKASNMSRMGIASSIGILILAGALNVLALAVQKFSEIDKDALIKGLAGVGAVLAEVAIFTKLTGNVKSVVPAAIALTIVGGALLIMAKALGSMGAMSWEEIQKGLSALGGALAIITVMFMALPKGIFLQSIALIDVATTMAILGKVLKTLGELDWEVIKKGLIAMGGAMAIIVATFALMKNNMLDSTALFITIGALFVLAQALKMLGSMSLVEIGTGLLAMAAAFGVIGVAGLLLAPLTPAILGLGIAIAILGAGCLAVGVGVLAFATGLAALSASGVAAGAAITVMITSIVGLIPFMMITLAQGLIDFARVIGEGAPVVAEAIKKVLLSIIDTIKTIAPEILNLVVYLITTLLDTLVASVPHMVDSGMKLILGILKGVADNIQGVVEAGVDVIVQFVKGVISKLPVIVDTAFKLIIAFINALADAIRDNHQQLYDACRNLIEAIVDAIMDLLPLMVNVGADIIRGMIKGIVSMAKALAKAAVDTVKSAYNAAKDFLDINSPSKKFAVLGASSGEGIVVGLQSMANKVSAASKDLAGDAVNSFSGVLSKVSDSLSGGVDVQPTIRPVLDLTDVHSGLNSAFGTTQSISVDSLRNKTATISNIDAARQSNTNQNGSKTVTSNDTSNSNGGGISVAIDKFINNRTQDVQAFAEELEFYRKQVSVGRGGI
jgi:tape measure domain-containing protein